MIKLIAADLDGTLLDSQQRLSPNLAPLLAKLQARSIRFVPASGRQYYNLLALFPAFAESLTFIAENGAVTVDRGETIFVDAISPDALLAPLQAARATPGVHVVFAGENSAYYEDQDPLFFKHASMYYARLAFTPDLMQAAQQDHICKIAVFSHQKAEAVTIPLLTPFATQFQVVLSGADWVDLMNPSANKGRAMHALQEKLGIAADECMAFGDYLNDAELLQSVTHSFAMANAHPDLKKISRHIAPSNDDDGVVRTICDVLQL